MMGTRVAQLIVVVGLALGPIAAKADSLAAALSHAYEHSGLLEQNRALLRSADEDVAQAVAALRPVINWAASVDHYWPEMIPGQDLTTASLALSGEIVLFDNGGNKLAIETQKEVVLSTRQALLNVEQQVLMRAVQAYFNVRRDNEFVALRQGNLRVLTQEFRAAQDRFEVGEVTRTDVSLAEARLAAARSLLAAAEGSVARSNEEFHAAVGRRPGSLQNAPAAPISHSVADAKAFAAQNHPSIREAQHAVTAAELTIQRADTALTPRVTLGGQVSVDDGGNDSGRISLSASGPLYHGGKIRSQARQLMSVRDARRAGLHLTTHSVRQGVGDAYANYSVARAGREAYEGQVRASRVAFEGVREEANLGSRTTLDVLNAEQQLLDAQTSLVSAQVDEVVASYGILASMGLLTAEHLRLNVQLYDATEYYNLVKGAPLASSAQGQALDRILQAIGD